MKSVRIKLLVLLLIPIIALSATIALLTRERVDSSIDEIVESLSLEISEKGAKIVDEWMKSVISDVSWLAGTNAAKDALKSGDWTNLLKTYLPPRIKNKPYEDVLIVDLTGKAESTAGAKINVKDRSYFKEIVEEGKELSISNAIISRATGKPIFVVAKPVKDDGKTIGLLCAGVTATQLAKIASEIKVGSSGYGWIVDGSGTVIAHPNQDYIMKLKITEASKMGIKGLEELASDILGGKTGYVKITLPDGSVNYTFYAPIETAKGWAFLVDVPEREIATYGASVAKSTTLLFGVLVALMAVIIVFVSGTISKPLKGLAQRIALFGEGDLTVTFQAKSEDEIGHIAQALNKMATSLKESFITITKRSEEISSSSDNLAKAVEDVSSTSQELAAQMEEINKSAQDASASIEEANAGIEEIASSAQNLAKAAQDLAERAQNVNASVKEGEQAINLIVEVIEKTKEKSKGTEKAVYELSEMAKNIGDILQTISSIAEQTNLLALNAAIEAARAGEAGRGFAVVADEIRKLAEGSKSATDKISQILNQIKGGAQEASLLTNETVKAIEEAATSSVKIKEQLLSILDEVEKMGAGIESLAATAQEQSASTQEMSSAMDLATRSITTIAEQIEQMTEAVRKQAEASNSLSTSADALSEIAEELHELIRRFKIN
ncbi:MAG: methyl-accepting chemotaxis protein [bacterium]|nr:methyl-accepting chemotaxis protein [bacterium]